MKTKIILKSATLALIALFAACLMLSGCETSNPYRAGFQAYQDGLVRLWGPADKWTPEQRQAALKGALALSDKYQADINARYASTPRYQPAPIIPYTDPYMMQNQQRGGTTTVIPNNPYNPAAGATVWAAHHGQIISDGNGGSTYWGD